MLFRLLYGRTRIIRRDREFVGCYETTRAAYDSYWNDRFSRRLPQHPDCEQPW